MIRFLLLLIILTSSAFSSTGFTLNEVDINCTPEASCDQRKVRYQGLLGQYRSLLHLKNTLRVLASDGGYQSFTYEVIKEGEKNRLQLNLKLKPVISEINVGFTDRNIEYDPVQLVTLKEGEFFEEQKLRESIERLKVRLENMGFPENRNTYKVIEKDGTVEVNVVITLGSPRIFKKVRTDTRSSFIRSYLKNKFLNLYNKPFDLTRFKMNLDEAQRELFSYGYYLISLDFTPVVKGKRVTLDIKVSNEDLYAFDFKNLKKEHRGVIRDLVIDLFRKYKRPLSESTIRNALKDHFAKKALLNAQIKVEKSDTKNSSKETLYIYRIFFDENGKTRISSLSFVGNTHFSESKLHRLYDKEAFELASLNYYDEEYLSYFQEYLKSQYVQKGFVQAKIFDPIIIFDQNKKTATVEYNIQEGPRAFVTEVEFNGLPEEFEDDVRAEISNKEGSAFNPVSMVEDIKTVARVLQDHGYYYAEVVNANDNNLISYNKTGTDVHIKYAVSPGPLVRLNRLLYLGNDKTRKKVIAKKIFLEQGEIITPSKIREVEAALSATGLFNSATVTPLRHNSKNAATDLIVKVVERDYGLVEVAPGFRTDLGLKLTGVVSYQNLGGYNRALTLGSQINRRTSFRTIDPVRREKTGHIFEHKTSLTFAQADIFDTLTDGSASVSYQTRRFYSFDANILRFNGTLSRDLTLRLSSALRYQYEDISQYDATQEFDNGSFQIGSLTPSLTYDLRNNEVNPYKGALFSLSSEFANPYFFSQKEEGSRINYYKLVSRNRFYFPYRFGTVAVSMVGGVQENLAGSDGFIPAIKVFRLSGLDIIRGFTDEEMNREEDGRDISQIQVTDTAYMGILKIEPRYFLTDTVIAGLFYDAGRVFVNKVDLGEIREAAGITFKILTPVGTLDFDYGIKLLRKRSADGRLEDPGRFHVSIGFF